MGVVVGCTDTSGKELRGQVGMGSMVTSGSLVCVIVRTFAQKIARDVGLKYRFMHNSCHVHHTYYNSN